MEEYNCESQQPTSTHTHNSIDNLIIHIFRETTAYAIDHICTRTLVLTADHVQ